MSFELVLILLVLAAFCAGYMDAIAGGGGMITIPALLIAGVDPLTAIGTNKVQGLFGTTSSSIAFVRGGHVPLRPLLPTMGIAFLGAVAGALLAQVIPTGWLAAALPYLLIAVAIYFALKPAASDIDSARRIPAAAFALGFVPVIGAYDGLFGPGAGSFYMIALVGLCGYGLLKATAHTKLLNLSSNLGGFAVFALTGSIHWTFGLYMGLAAFAGAQVGARSAMAFGARLIKPLLVTVSIALAIRLLWTS